MSTAHTQGGGDDRRRQDDEDEEENSRKKYMAQGAHPKQDSKENKPPKPKSGRTSDHSAENDGLTEQTTEESSETPQEGSRRTSPRKSEDGSQQEGSPKKSKDGPPQRSPRKSSDGSPRSGSSKKSNETPPPESSTSPPSRSPRKHADSPRTPPDTAAGAEEGTSPREEPASPPKSPRTLQDRSPNKPAQEKGGSPTEAAEERTPVQMSTVKMQLSPGSFPRRSAGGYGSGRAGSIRGQLRSAVSDRPTWRRLGDSGVPSPVQDPPGQAGGSERQRHQSESVLHDADSQGRLDLDQTFVGHQTRTAVEPQLRVEGQAVAQPPAHPQAQPQAQEGAELEALGQKTPPASPQQ